MKTREEIQDAVDDLVRHRGLDERETGFLEALDWVLGE